MRSVLKGLWWAVNVVLVAVVVLVAWGLVEPRVVEDVEVQPGPVVGLPAAWEGRRIAVIGDLQIGMWLDNPGTARDLVGRIVRERPAAVLLAGDFVLHATRELDAALDTVQEILRPLTAADLPTFAVLGNHDWGMPFQDADRDPEQAEAVRRGLEAIGIRVLENEAVALESPESSSGDRLWIVGIGAEYPGLDDPQEALDPVPDGEPRVVFFHNPDTFPKIPAGAAPLAVAGHTHGGQIRIAGFPQWGWKAIFAEDEVHTDGWIAAPYGAPGNRLYVNRGIGFSLVPLRINCPPELTLFVLEDAEEWRTAR